MPPGEGADDFEGRRWIVRYYLIESAVDIEAPLAATSGLFEHSDLKILQLSSLNWKFADKLRQLKGLENLELSHSGIKSFAPLSELKKLERLSLSVCRSLQNLDGVENLTRLKLLSITEVHNFSSLEAISPLENLEVLTIADCGEIASLKPLERLKNLRAVSFAGAKTWIADGDLTPLTNLPKLSMLMFGARRHYSHKLIKNWDWNNLRHPDTLLAAA